MVRSFYWTCCELGSLVVQGAGVLVSAEGYGNVETLLAGAFVCVMGLLSTERSLCSGLASLCPFYSLLAPESFQKPRNERTVESSKEALTSGSPHVCLDSDARL